MENIPNYSKFKRKAYQAFTLVEILLVIGLLGVVTLMGLPLINGVVYQNDIDNASVVIVSTIRQAENNSRNGIEDSVWGVRLEFPNVILFKGGTYATRDSAYDTSYSLNSRLTLSGLTEITFSKMYAIPSVTGNIMVTNSNGNTSTININAKGTLFY